MIEKLENGDRKVTAKLTVDVTVVFTNGDEESDEGTVRFLIEEDLQDLGYEINSVEVIQHN